MNRNYIPIGTVQSRKISLNESCEEDKTVSMYGRYQEAMESIDNESIVQSFVTDCCYRTGGSKYIKECLSLIDATADKSYHESLVKMVCNELLPKCSVEEAEQLVSNLSNEDDKITFQNTLSELQDCDRVLNNYNSITGRYNLDSFKKSLQLGITLNNDKTIKEATESFAELMDTYNMPLRKKVAVAMETGVYLNSLYGDADKNDLVIESIVNYFMCNTPVITDRDFKSIKTTLETNSFIKDSELSGVQYIFDKNHKMFSDRIIQEVSKDSSITKEYKALIQKIAECKSAKVAKGLIKAAFTLISSTFIIAAVVPFTTVVVLLCAVYALILTVALSPAVVISTIRDELKNTEAVIEPYRGKDKEVIKRFNMVYKFIGDISSNISSGDGLLEASEVLDKYIPDSGEDAPVVKQKLEDDGLDNMFVSVNDICEPLTESDKFADSEDAKQLLKNYRAEQKKTVPGFKRVLTKIFSDKPENIIDEMPNIFAIIRTCFIVSTITIPVIGPAIALVGFICDSLLKLHFKREETEKVLNAFKKEKEECEKKYDKLKDGDKKDDLSEYIDSIDKCIDKLQEYRDNLYTDEELEKQYELEESTMNYSNKLNVDGFYSMYGASLIAAVSKAVQISRNGIIRQGNNFQYDEYTVQNEVISKKIASVTPTELLSFYTTDDGLVDIPICKITCINSEIKDPSNAVYDIANEICSKINDFIDKNFTATSYTSGSSVIITINCFKCISKSTPSLGQLSEAAVDMTATFLAYTEMANTLNQYSDTDILESLYKCFDEFSSEDWKELPSIVESCNLDNSDFIDMCKDYKSALPAGTDIDTLNGISDMINNLTRNSVTGLESNDVDLISTLESVELLSEIITEAKARKASKKKKSTPIDAVKSAATNASVQATIAKNAVKDKSDKVKAKVNNNGIVKAAKAKVEENKKKPKVGLGTTVKLGAKAAANKAKDVSTKEKEVSRTLDAYAGSFIQHTKDALRSKRRESIIKGSIIPSFSQLIKGAIVTGVVAVFNPVVAAITAIGALGASKYLNKKERQMLLEELEVEMKVIEREIEKNPDDPKKYKQLLMYQRKIQREAQRIKYNITIKGRDIPDPTL